MRMMIILAGAALATAAALPGRFGIGSQFPGARFPRPSVSHDGSCNDGPSVSAGEWALAREGKRREGSEHPPVMIAAAMEADVTMIGRQDGTLFSHTGCGNGSTIMKLEVWGERSMEGIRLTFYDGEIFAAGSPKGCYDVHDFAPGERVTYLEQASDRAGGRYGKIKFRTSANKEFAPRWDDGEDGELPMHYTFDFQSGFVCGMQGYQTDGVGALAFLFAPKASSVSLVIDPASVPANAVTFADETKIFHYVNDGNTPKFELVDLPNRVFAYESTMSLGFWASTTVSALVEVLDGSVTPHDSSSSSSSSASEDAEASIQRLKVAGGEHFGAFELPSLEFHDTRKFSLDIPVEAFKFEIPPGKECDFVVKKHVANADKAPWTGTETFVLDDGSSYAMSARGNLTGFDVVQQSIRRICFPVGKYNPYHSH